MRATCVREVRDEAVGTVTLAGIDWWGAIPMASTTDLLKYVIAELSERGFDVTKTALVKLLYLADVEAVRRGRPRVSSLQWICFKYGPYAFEIEDTLRQISGKDIDELAGLSTLGRAYRVYRSPDHEETPRVSPEERAIINVVLDRWGGEDLNKILNYVYFETEPMLEAKWRQPLNFDSVRPRKHPVSLADYLAQRADPADVQRLSELKREFWARARARDRELVEPIPSPRYDDVFLAGIRATDESDSSW
jgi:hypothetical protein